MAFTLSTCRASPAQASGEGQHTPTPSRRRRSLLLAVPALTWAVAVRPSRAENRLAENAGGVDVTSSPLVQELLKRTEEKRDERKKERLDDYYRRNFGDYLEFQAGSPGGADGGENQLKIKEWLRKNSKPALQMRPAGDTFPPRAE